jgi:hypothetical protein
MKTTVFRYGIFAALTILGLGLINLFIVAKKASFEVQEATGYLTIFISMIFVFLGIRYYRNKVNDGYLSFGQGLKTGILIVLPPAVIFGLFDILYTQVINPAWADEYFSHATEQLKKTTDPAKLDAALRKMESQKELFSSPVMEFLLMTATVLIIGLIVALISSLALMRRKKPALN